EGHPGSHPRGRQVLRLTAPCEKSRNALRNAARCATTSGTLLVTRSPAMPDPRPSLSTETTPAASPESGQEWPTLAGRYRLLEEVGRGGMGAVLRAEDPDLGRSLAVKLLLRRHSQSGPAARRFLDEARLTAQLQHPGIPPVHEVGALPDGRPFFAMK